MARASPCDRASAMDAPLFLYKKNRIIVNEETEKRRVGLRRWWWCVDGVTAAMVRRCVLPVPNGDVGEEGRKVNVEGENQKMKKIRILYVFRT